MGLYLFYSWLSYQNYTKSQFYCKLENSEVGVFNTTLLVSEEYGRSVAASAMYFVTPDEKIYNYQSFAGKLKNNKFSLNSYRNRKNKFFF